MAKAKKHQKDYEHEINLAVLRIMERDPTAKYFIGASLGMGATWATTLFGKYTGEKPKQTPTQKAENYLETILGAGSPLLSAAGVFDFNKDGEGGLAGNVFGFATGSYTAWCMVNCILASASGGQDGGMFKALAGAVV